MAWVRGLFVLLTISVDVGVRTAVQPTTLLPVTETVPMSTGSNGLSIETMDQPFGQSIKSLPTTSDTTIGQHHPSTPALKPTTKNSNAKSRSSFESVVILSSNAQQDAEEMYDKAMKQYDENVYTTRQLCSAWEKCGCQCSGTVEQLTLSCRSIGLNETPTDLPKSLIKL